MSEGINKGDIDSAGRVIRTPIRKAKPVFEAKGTIRDLEKDEMFLPEMTAAQTLTRRAFTSTEYAQKLLGDDAVDQFPVTVKQYDAAKPLLEETEDERNERLFLEKSDVIGLEEVPHITNLPLGQDSRMNGRAQDLLGEDFAI